MNNQPREYTTIAQPVIALQWDGSAECAAALREFLGSALIALHDRGWLWVQSGSLTALVGDWVIKQANGTFAIVPRAVFDELYVAVGPLDAYVAAAQHKVPRGTDDGDEVDPTLSDA